MSISRYTIGLETLKKEQPEVYERISKNLNSIIHIQKMERYEEHCIEKFPNERVRHLEELKSYRVFKQFAEEKFLEEIENIKSNEIYDVITHIYNAVRGEE